MKAQMSLEMIVGLLILLVVAAVIISLFMRKITEFTSMSNWQEDLDFRRFKSECESLCKGGTEGQMVQFCSKKLNKKDLNGNHKVEALPSEILLEMCEDAVYCFHVTACESEGGKINHIDCRQILCGAWSDVYGGDASKASTKVMELVPGYGTCTLKDDENWWRIAKFGPNPPCGGSAQSSVSLQCVKDSNNPNNVVCVWVCPATVTASNTGLLSVAGTTHSIPITNPVGSYTFQNLNTGASYVVTLTCDRNNPAYSATQTVQL